MSDSFLAIVIKLNTTMIGFKFVRYWPCSVFHVATKRLCSTFPGSLISLFKPNVFDTSIFMKYCWVCLLLRIILYITHICGPQNQYYFTNSHNINNQSDGHRLRKPEIQAPNIANFVSAMKNTNQW